LSAFGFITQYYVLKIHPQAGIMAEDLEHLSSNSRTVKKKQKTNKPYFYLKPYEMFYIEKFFPIFISHA
jgi:hypothetical protein